MQQTLPVPATTVLDALRASPAGPVLDAPLPVFIGSDKAALPPLPQLPDSNAITELLQSIPVPALPEIDQLVRPLTELGSMFGTGIVDALDPAALLQQGSRMLDTAMSLGRSALHALPESWEGPTAESATTYGLHARQSTVELADRGDRIGEVTRAATATVERGNVELTGIAHSFVAVAVAAVPVAMTPPGQAALIASALEHLHAALAVVARTRGELVVHTGAMTALTTPVPVPAPVASALPDPRAIVTAATDTASGFTHAATAGSRAVTTGFAETSPTSYAPTVPTGYSAAGTMPSASVGSGVPGGFSGAGTSYGPTAVGAGGFVGAAVPPSGTPGTAPAATGNTGRGPMPIGAPAGATRGTDDERRTSPGFLTAAGTGTDVVGELPLVTPAVIGGIDDTW